jgi:hypothetical protein
MDELRKIKSLDIRKQFYDEQWKGKGDPEFEDLSASDMIEIFGTIAFSGWKIRQGITDYSRLFPTMDELIEAIKVKLKSSK